MNFVDVALSTPIRSTFTYKNESNSCLVGKRVIVEFGRRKLLGVVVAESVQVNTDLKLKKIQEVLDIEPILTSKSINKASTIANYYLHPIGEVLFSFLPTILRKKKKSIELKKYRKAASLEKTLKPKLPKLTNESLQEIFPVEIFFTCTGARFTLLRYVTSMNDKTISYKC